LYISWFDSMLNDRVYVIVAEELPVTDVELPMVGYVRQTGAAANDAPDPLTPEPVGPAGPTRRCMRPQRRRTRRQILSKISSQKEAVLVVLLRRRVADGTFPLSTSYPTTNIGW
jgi:hypothetical protein